MTVCNVQTTGTALLSGAAIVSIGSQAEETIDPSRPLPERSALLAHQSQHVLDHVLALWHGFHRK